MIRLTLRQMEYFDALAQSRHFGRAAELAGVTQPALSAQIAEMEERLGCRLFERGGRAVELTEEGRVLQPRIERILSDAREVESVARRGRLAMEGRFRLGIIPTVAPYLLPRLLPALREQFPSLALELREAVTQALLDEAVQGRLDAAIVALPVEQPALISEALFEDRFFLAVPAADETFVEPPVPPESPALERLMLLEEGHCMREQALAICGSLRPVAMARYGATSLTTLTQMVAHGFGLTLIPEIALEATQATPGVRVVQFSEPAPRRTICMAWRRGSGRRAEYEALAGAIRRLVAPSEDTHSEPEPHERQDDEAGCEGRLAVADAVAGHVDPGMDVT